MTQLIPENNGLELVKRQRVPLMDGTLPDWLTLDRGDPDSLSVFDASNEGGFVRMESDDVMDLVSAFDIAPQYNVVELEADVRFQSGSPRQFVGFVNYEDSGVSESIYYFHEDSTLRVIDEGEESRTSTPRVAGGNVRRVRLLWYTDEDRVQLFFDGRAAADLQSAPGSAAQLSVKLVDSRLDIMSLAVGYYRRGNAPVY